MTNVEWLSIESSGDYTQRVYRGAAEWEGMDGIPIIEMLSGGTQITTWTVEDAYVEYSYASVARGGDLRDPVPRAAFEGDVEVTEYREYTTFQPQVGIPVGGPPGSRSGDPTAELDLVIPIEHTLISAERDVLGAVARRQSRCRRPTAVDSTAQVLSKHPADRSRVGRRGLTGGDVD